MRILVTGGMGFIGKALVKHLVSLGHDICILDNLSHQIHGNYTEGHLQIPVGARLMIGDINDASKLEAILPGIECVVHLAAETGTTQSMYEIEKYTNTNVNGTAVLLEAIKKLCPELDKFVLASSRAVYGEGAYRCVNGCDVGVVDRSDVFLAKHSFNPRCACCDIELMPIATTEATRSNPKSTKLAQELLVTQAFSVGPTESSILRFQNVYGPGQSLHNPYTGIVSIFYRLARANKDVTLFEQGLPSRDFIYIDDLVRMVADVIQEKTAGGTFNVGSGVSTSVKDVANAIVSKVGSESSIVSTNAYRVGDIFQNFASMKHYESTFVSCQVRDFFDGVGDFVSWANQIEHLEQDTFEQSFAEGVSTGFIKNG